MTDFASIGRERREEWRRFETTAMAMAVLREAEAVAAQSVLREAESESDSVAVARKAGIRMGLAKAIELLAEE